MSDAPLQVIRQHPERSVPGEAWDILAAGHVAHVGFVDGGHPYVIPFSYHFEPGGRPRLFLHGGHEGRALSTLASGVPVCVEVTLLDGLVYSRTALFHSMNYRSAIAFGRGRPVTDDAEKSAVFERMIGRYFPGRTAGRDYEPGSAAHLATTSLIEIEIEAVSAKARRGGPKGPRDADPDAPGSSGVVPLGER